MIITRKLEMAYGGRTLFEGVDLRLSPKERYGIVGANGSGKSTLLRILGGDEHPASGKIEIPPESQVGFLRQDHYKYENVIILEVVMQGDEILFETLQEKEQLLQAEHTDEAGFRLAELEEIIGKRDGYSAESRAHKILIGLGIPEEKHYEEMSTLSGGFKLRVLLAKTLFGMPELLLLDEPTNHLDIVAIRWLEKFLRNEYKGVLLVISHDQYFLNNVATHILDIDFNTITPYTGNYDQFIEAKALKLLEVDKAQEGFERKTANMQAFVDRFRYKSSKARQAQSKIKQIEKLRDALPETLESSRRAPYFHFGEHIISGKSVLKIKHLKKAYGEHHVLQDVSFNVYRGDKVGIIGPNGIGKSTLLKIVMKDLAADSGEFEWGQKVVPGYFPQDHHERLEGDASVFAWLKRSGKPEEKVRQSLGRMCFGRDDLTKSLDTLSGGEAARLLFAEIILQNPNVLILDEPTNHLDMETIEALIAALDAFEGTLILVSHNRHFLKEVCNRIILIEHDKLSSLRYDSEEAMDELLDSHFNL